MQKTEIKEQLQIIFRDVFEDETLIIQDDMTADDVEDWDSLTHFQMIMEVEQKFNIKFSIDEMEKLANVSDLVTRIEKHMTEGK